MRSKMLAALLAATLMSLSTTAQARSASDPPPPPAIGILEGATTPHHRLTIISAFSCVYCRAFDEQAMQELRTVWARRGVQLETIPVVIAPTDRAAAIAATCGDMRGYGRRTTMLFRAQPEIRGNWNGAGEAARKRALAMPENASALEIGQLAGIVTLAPALGLTREALEKCLADPQRQERQLQREKTVDTHWFIPGTPTIFLDGKPVGSTWQSVRAALISIR